MDKYNYAKAIPILKKIAANEKKHDAAIPMLADCYRMQHDIPKAKSTYAEVVKLPDAKPESFYYYAQALQSTGDYEKASEMFQKYSDLNPEDPRGKLFASHCDSVTGPWKGVSAPYEVKIANDINTIQSDFGPVFYDGELIFASDHNTTPGEAKEYGWTGRGYLNIMKSSPDLAGNFWGSMGEVSGFSKKINQEYHDGPATFTTDGNTIFFTRSYFGKAKRQGAYKTNLLKIYYATKTNGEWGVVMPFFLNSKDYSVGHPTLSADGQTLYFVSDMPGGQGKTDIWMCKRDSSGWGQPLNMGKTINTSEKEMFPTMVGDDILYFSSEGQPGYGALDIFKTQNINGTWTTPENLHPPINSSFDDFTIAFAPDKKIGFFSSNRPGGMGSDDIYAFRFVEPAPELLSTISGYVKDRTTLQSITGATVFLFNKKTGNVKVLKTDSTGMYSAVIDTPEDYTVKAMMNNYLADCLSFPMVSIKTGTTNFASRDLLLDKLTIDKTFVIDNIYYDFDKYNLRADARVELDKLVKLMKENPVNIEIGSHTDCRGSSAYNDKLSQKRAESAVNYIISSGIEKSRITAKGYGESQLLNKCADGVICTSKEHQVNRRTEFKIISTAIIDSKTDQFDPDTYKQGQELETKMLPSDFFMKCK